MRIVCSCGIQLLVEGEHPASLGPCPGCGRPLDVGLHRSAALLGSLGAEADPRPAAPDTAPEALPPPPALPPDEPADPLASLTAPAAPDARRSVLRLYSPSTVAMAGLLGGLLAGCILLASNYRRLRRVAMARITLVAGIVGTLAILAAVWEYADVPPRLGAVRYLGCLFLAQFVASGLVLLAAARIFQGRAFAAHRQAGGKAVPAASVVGPCLLCAALVFGAQVLVGYPVTWRGSGGGMVFGDNEELYFTEGVSREQATRLGRKLQEIGLFDNRGAKTVVVEKADAGYQVRFFVAQPAPMRLGPGPRDDFEGLRADFAGLPDLLSREVFDGAPVEILFFDQQNNYLLTIR